MLAFDTKNINGINQKLNKPINQDIHVHTSVDGLPHAL